MTLVVEDGSGLANAQSLASVEYVTDFWALRGGNTVWTGNPGKQEAGCVLASDYLCMGQLFNWRGMRHPTARLVFPRVGAFERNGNEIPANVVPPVVLDAVALLAPRAIAAMLAGTSLLAPAERGGKVKSESAVGFSTTYADDAPTYTVQQDVLALVHTLLRDAVDPGMTDLVYVSQTDLPADNPALLMATYRNPAAP